MVEISHTYPRPINENTNMFLQAHLQAEIPAARSRAALSYIESAWVDIAEEAGDLEPRLKSVSHLFVASVKLFGTEEIFNHYATTAGLNFRNYSGLLQDLTHIRNEARESISEFLEVHRNASTTDRYAGLNETMQDAASIIYGHELSGDQKVKISQQLNGLLAERKALLGLHRAGFTKSRFATPTEDAFKGVDMFAAVAGYELPLQIRSSSSRDARLSIEQSKIPIVRVPTHISRKPFNMNKPEINRLTEFVASNLREVA